MAISTLRPNSTTANSGVTFSGSASAHGAVSDDSDSSYLDGFSEVTNDSITFALGDLSLPSGAAIKSLAVRIRSALTSAGSGACRMRGELLIGGAEFELPQTISWTGITTVQYLGSPGAVTDYVTLTDALIDAASIRVRAQSGLSTDASRVRVYEIYLDVTYVGQPELTVDAPVGPDIDTNAPVVAWTPDLDSDGGAQTFYEVAIVADGDDPDTDPILVGSGAVASSASSWQLVDPLPDGTYDCYVRIAQTVNSAQHWSDWEKSDFVINALLPAAPTLALVPETSHGRMRLDIEEGAGGDATTDIFEVQASYDGGETYRTIRTPEGFGLATPDAGAAMLWDHEGGNGQEVSYRVRAGHDYEGLYAWSAWVAETDMWGPTRDQWLKHALEPSLNMKVRIHAYGSSSRGVRQGKMQPLGRSTPVTATDKRLAREGAVAFLVETEEEGHALDALLDAPGGLPLLLQPAATDKRPDRWVILGQADREYLIDKAYIGDFAEAFGWVEMARP